MCQGWRMLRTWRSPGERTQVSGLEPEEDLDRHMEENLFQIERTHSRCGA